MARDVFVFRIGQLGDTLVALPAIHRIAGLHLGSRLWLITNAPAPGQVTAWDVLQHAGLFDGVLFYDRRDAWSLLRLALRLRKSRGAWLYYLSPPRSAGRLRRDRWFLRWVCGVEDVRALPKPAVVTPRDASGRLLVLPRESERLLRTVDAHARSPAAPLLRPSAAAVAKVASLLEAVAQRPLIAVGPGSKMPAKRWFLERYVEVCRRIVEQHAEVALVILGGPEDRAAGAAVVSAVGPERALNLAGRTNIIESAAALAQCGLYLGNDTGTMHLAAAMGVPCVALFTSRENRDTWSPWGGGHAVLRRDLPCSGCMLEHCEVERMRCLDLISVADVWTEVAARLPDLRARVAQPRVLPFSPR